MSQRYVAPDGTVLVIPAQGYIHPVYQELPHGVLSAVSRLEMMILFPLAAQFKEMDPVAFEATSWDVAGLVGEIGWENIELDADAELRFWDVANEWCNLKTVEKTAFAKYFSYLVDEIQEAVDLRARDLADEIEFIGCSDEPSAIFRPFGTVMEHEELMSIISMEPLIASIVAHRTALLAMNAQPDPFYFQNRMLGHTRGYIIDELPMIHSDVHAASSVEEISKHWDQMKRLADEWKTPILVGDSFEKAGFGGAAPDDATSYTKDIVWDSSDEETTDPGAGPQKSSSAAFPRLVNLEGEVRCYLCAKLSPFVLQRSATDVEIICSACAYTHLGYEIQSDGHLVKRPEDKLKLYP